MNENLQKIQEYVATLPNADAYKNLSEEDFASKVQEDIYPDMDKDTFFNKLGITKDTKFEEYSTQADPLDESGEYAQLTRGRISADTLSKVQPRTKDLGKEVYEKAIEEEEAKTVSALAKDEEWNKNANIIWNQENPGEEFDPEEEGYDSIGDWFMDRHSKLGNDLTNLGITAYNIGDMTPEQQKAWADSLKQFEVADADVKSFLRAVKNTAIAPETIIGLVGTLGVGALAKLIGGKAASTAAKLSFKNQLTQQLAKKNIVEETVKDVGKDKVVKKQAEKVTDDQLKKQAARTLRAKNIGTGAVTGGIYAGGFNVGEQIIADPNRDINVAEVATATGLGLVTGGLLGRIVPVGREAENIATAVRKELDETPSTEKVKVKSLQKETDVVDPKKPVRHNITERIAELNTKVGRFFKSNVGLPKEVFNAALKRERGSDSALTVKRLIKNLETEMKKDSLQRIKNKVSTRITDEDVNNFLDEGTIAPSLQGTKVLDALKEVGDAIKTNENKLNDLLGLEGDKKLGINRGEGKFYITRSFEANNNPAYLKKIIDATEGKLDGEFLTKVEDARKVFRKKFPKETAEQIDDRIVQTVRRLSGESDSTDFILDIPKILGDLTPKSGTSTGKALNALKKRQELNQPILNLLGERKDALGRLSETLITQQKLLKSSEYFSELNKFAVKALQKGEDDAATIELGGLIDFLPKQRVTIKRKKGTTPPARQSENLEDLVEKQLGKTVKDSGVFLKDMYTDDTLYRYFENGIDYWTNSKLGGGAFGNTLAKIAAYGQATQTVLDIPAYFVNSYGAVQNLGSNGYIFSAIGKDNVVRQATNDVFEMYRLGNKKALQRLEKLKEQGVIDSDLSSELIRKNINLYGDKLDKPLGKAYKKGMDTLSQAYGVPDTYAKLIAHEIEYRELKKMYGNTVADDELFEMASQIVRDVMPSYSVAAPGARMLSRLPIGTYALFPSEMVRTTKNILKYSVSDLLKGANEIKKGNVKLGGRLIKRGVRRGSGLAATTYGLESLVNANNEAQTEMPLDNYDADGKPIRSSAEQNKINLRAYEEMGGAWNRGGKPFILKGAQEVIDKKTGQRSIIVRYANSSQYDALDFGKVATRLTGRILGGDNVTETDIADSVKALAGSILGPYTSPKFVVDGLINIAASSLGHGDLFLEEQPGINLENTKRAVLELAEALEPGTSQAVRAYFDQMKASEIADVARNSYGFPLTMNDMNSWLTTGQRTTTNDLNKSIGYTLYKDMRKLDLSDKSFISYLRQLKPRQITPEIINDVKNKYKEAMQVKRENYKKIKNKMKLFSEMSYQDLKGNAQKFGIDGVVNAVAGPNFTYEKNSDKASEIFYTPFIDAVQNPLDNDNLVNIFQEKFGQYNPTGLIGELAKVYTEEINKSLKEEQGEK